ncbi:hypothetical protein CGZ93_05925 [Enemella dayhoffiae]|uniref:Uncharacterized protein n=1 Tax=Enemella dayhoffiae TaxID=2016507 RepID=A0A255H7D8_9ACTN|nr:hypothetical protein [Enemella dayhoffiae]OYO23477.1 hypothetical protein CGZ93_05925 [Enemella dayhoffiae]
MQQLPVFYDPERVEQRIGAYRRRVIWQAVSAGLSVAALAVLFLHSWLVAKGQPGEVGQMLRYVLTFGAVIGLVMLLIQLLWLRRLRAARREVGDGLAMLLSHRGIETADGAMPWEDITRVAVANGRPGHGYRLDIVTADRGACAFPLDGLNLLPGSLDSATRAYSAGRHGVDLTVVDD